MELVLNEIHLQQFKLDSEVLSEFQNAIEAMIKSAIPLLKAFHEVQRSVSESLSRFVKTIPQKDLDRWTSLGSIMLRDAATWMNSDLFKRHSKSILSDYELNLNSRLKIELSERDHFAANGIPLKSFEDVCSFRQSPQQNTYYYLGPSNVNCGSQSNLSVGVNGLSDAAENKSSLVEQSKLTKISSENLKLENWVIPVIAPIVTSIITQIIAKLYSESDAILKACAFLKELVYLWIN